MKASTLISILQNVDADSDVLFRPSNSSYVEDFSETTRVREVRTFWGKDHDSVIIFSSGQVGQI